MNLGKVKASLFREIHTWDLSLVAQWLRFRASNADGTILIPGWGTMIPHIVWYGQLKKKNRDAYSIGGVYDISEDNRWPRNID